MRLILFLILVFIIAAAAAEEIPAATIAAIDLSDARTDDGWVAPVSRSLDHLARKPERRQRFEALMQRIDAWAPASTGPAALYCRLNAAALADLGRSDLEAEVNYAVFASLTALPGHDAVVQSAAAIALGSTGAHAQTDVPETGLRTTVSPGEVEARIRLLARKLLGRLLGTLPIH